MKRNFKSLNLVILMLAIVTISLLLVACNTQISYKLNFVVDNETYSTIETNGKIDYKELTEDIKESLIRMLLNGYLEKSKSSKKKEKK